MIGQVKQFIPGHRAVECNCVPAPLAEVVAARRPLLAELVLSAAAVGWLGRVSPHGSFASGILGPSILASVGLGNCFVAIASAATSGVAAQEAGLAIGLINTCRQCGGSIGLAVLVTVANKVTQDHAASGSAHPIAVTVGYDRAFVVAGLLIAVGAAAAALSLRRNTTAASVRVTAADDGIATTEPEEKVNMTAIGHEGPGPVRDARTGHTPGHTRPDGVCGALTACALALILIVG
jgi:hypothetical protein